MSACGRAKKNEEARCDEMRFEERERWAPGRFHIFSEAHGRGGALSARAARRGPARTGPTSTAGHQNNPRAPPISTPTAEPQATPDPLPRHLPAKTSTACHSQRHLCDVGNTTSNHDHFINIASESINAINLNSCSMFRVVCMIFCLASINFQRDTIAFFSTISFNCFFLICSVTPHLTVTTISYCRIV